MAYHGLGAAPGGREIDVDDAIPKIVVQFPHVGTRGVETSAMYKDVDSSEPCDRGLYHSRKRSRVDNIHRASDALAAALLIKLSRQVVDLLILNVGKKKLGSLLSKGLCDTSPNPASRARDNDRFVRETKP
jgi:hypothetical protein